MLGAAAVLTGAAPEPVVQQNLSCSLALVMLPQRQLTTPTPVTISFAVEGKALRAVHVVDKGAILFPGGNMRVVQKPGVTSVETVTVPDERPGEWTGAVEKTMYRLILKSGALAKAVEIGIAKTPAKETGRVSLVWNASSQPDGLPQPLTGTGIGNCAVTETKVSQ